MVYGKPITAYDYLLRIKKIFYSSIEYLPRNYYNYASSKETWMNKWWKSCLSKIDEIVKEKNYDNQKM